MHYCTVKKSAYKWTHAVQTYVVQGSTVFTFEKMDSNYFSPFTPWLKVFQNALFRTPGI